MQFECVDRMRLKIQIQQFRKVFSSCLGASAGKHQDLAFESCSQQLIAVDKSKSNGLKVKTECIPCADLMARC